MKKSIKNFGTKKDKDENKFYSLFETSINGVILGKPDGTILEANNAVIDIFGYSLSKIKKLGRQGLFEMNDSNMSKADAIRTTKGKAQGILIGIRKNGERFPCEFSSVIFKNEFGENRTTTILTDITERKKAEDEITLLLNNTEESFVLLDTQLKIISFNNQFATLYKLLFKKEIRKGDLILNYAQKNRLSTLKKIYSKVLKGELIDDEVKVDDGKNEATYLHIRYKPAYDQSSNIIGAFVAIRDITEKKLVYEKLKNNEQQLQKNNEQLIKLTENVDTVLFQFEISPTGKMTFPFISKSLHKIVPGIDIELLKEDASSAFSKVHPDDLPALLTSIEKSRKKLTDWTFEYRSIAFKDKISWIKGASHPNKKEDGTVVWFGYLLDITERVINVEKLQESNNRYEIIEKATNDTIWEADYQTLKIAWNKGISSVFGYNTNDEVIHHTSWWYSKIHPDDLPRVKLKSEKCFVNKEKRWEDEYRFLCADNTYKYVSDRGYLIKNENGEAIKMIGAMQDVTSQKKEELRLKLLESVITNTTDSVIITEPDSTGDQKIIYVNDPFIKLTGYSIEELIGQSPRMFQGIFSNRKELDKIKKAILHSKECHVEIINYKKNGEEFWVNISISPVKNELGKPTHFIAIEKDITERKLHEIEREHIIAELSQNNKDLKQFSYVTSHNLRSPIANLLGLTTLLDHYRIPNKSLKQILEGIKQSALMFDDTVKDLTSVLVIKDQINIVKEQISLTEITNKVLSQLSITVDDNEVKVNYNFKEAPFVNFTNAYLESVFQNLFTNSIKYKSPKRKLKINISSNVSPNYIVLKFGDNGIGLDVERHKEKLFKLYQRFHDNPDGKGLGLYLIKSQIEALGGCIAIESKVDVGTTFIIKFKI